MDRTQNRRTKLLRNKRHIERKLASLDARERERERKRDTRRKIVAGAIVLKHAEDHPHFASRLFGLIDRFVLDRDRHLFDLREEQSGMPPTLKTVFTGAALNTGPDYGEASPPPDHVRPVRYPAHDDP